MVQNKGLVFKQVPVGLPVAGKDLVVETREFDLEAAPPAGGITAKNLYVSFDPYQRGRMRDAKVESYSPPFPLGSVITNGGILQVLKSDSSDFKAGDLINGFVGTEEYSIVPKEQLAGFKILDNPYNLDPKIFLGALGMPGLTAYSSLYAIGKPVKGETIFISSAAGAVGQLVGQLAKHEGLTVIGSVGSDDKLDFILKELKFDAGFNYKTEKAADALKRLAPKGIDIYYENVGGEQLEAAIDSLNTFGRIVACGMISQYNKAPAERYAVPNLMNIVAKRLLIRGFIVSDKDMGPVYAKEHHDNVSKWIHEGKFISKIHVFEGLDNAADGFIGMLQGKNYGKAVLQIAAPEKK